MTAEPNARFDFLVSCPICNHRHDDGPRLPLHMSCCDVAVCHSCVTVELANGYLTCPCCREKRGVCKALDSIPVDSLVVELLAMLDSDDAFVPICSLCDFRNTAVAKCGRCQAVICQSCLATHSVDKLPVEHRVTLFELPPQNRAEVSRKPVELSSTNALALLEEKQEQLGGRVKVLNEIHKNIVLSKKRATHDITRGFDNIIKEIQQRKSALLNEVEVSSEQRLCQVTRAKAAHQLSLERTKKCAARLENGRRVYSSCWPGRHKIGVKNVSSIIVDCLQDAPYDIDYCRAAVSYVPSNVRPLSSVIRSAGMVRTVTFAATATPSGVLDNAVYNSIALGHDIPVGQLGDQVLILKNGTNTHTLFCPSLGWDAATAGKTITTSESVVTNNRPARQPPETGCRIQAARHVMASKPLLMRNGQRALYEIRLGFKLKVALQSNKILFETALTNAPVETAHIQPSGLSVSIISCAKHFPQLCLHVVYDNKLVHETPITARNEVGRSSELLLGIMLNSAGNMIYVIDVGTVKVVCPVPDVDFGLPLWVMAMVSWPSWSSMSAGLVSGTSLDVSKDINELLATLQ